MGSFFRVALRAQANGFGFLRGLALMLLCCALGARAQSGWMPLQGWSISENLWSVTLAYDRIVAVGERGAIVSYPLSGEGWNGASSGTDAWLVGVAYGPGRLVAVGDRGTILTSDDAGVTWTARTSPTTTRLNAVAYGGGRWLAVGEQGVVLVSSDGAAWTQAPAQGTGFLRALVFARGQFIFGGAGGRLYATADGATFRSLPIATTADIEALAASPTRLWLVGGNGLWATATALDAWTISPATTATTFRALAVRSDEEAVAAGDFSAAVFRAGTWRAESPVPPFLATSAVTTEAGIFAVGFSGGIFGAGIARAPLANDVTVQWSGGGAPVEYGSTVVLTASFTGQAEATYQWYEREVAIPGATAREYTIPRITPDNASVRVEYRARDASGREVTGSQGITVPVYPAGQPEVRDPAFSYPLGAVPSAVAPLADGKVLVAGSFSATPSGVPTYGLVRLLPSGAVDPSFIVYGGGLAPTSSVRAIHPLPDGGAYVRGNFSTIGGSPRNGLARLAADGRIDETFRPPVFNPQIYRSLFGAGERLYVQLGDSSIYLQPGPVVLQLGRDGAPDPAFARLERHTLVAVDASGRVLAFDLAAQRLRRYSPEGVRDTSYTETPGTVFTDVTQWRDDFSTGLALESGLYVASYVGNRVTTSYTFRKLLPDGGLDPAYPTISTSAGLGNYVSFAYRPDGGLWVNAPREPLSQTPSLRSYSPSGALERDRYAQLNDFTLLAVAADGSLLGVANRNTTQRSVVRVRPLSGEPGRLDNLSVRAYLPSTGEPLIAGFVTPGAQGPNALLRAIGPGLAGFGVGDAVRDPRLSLYAGAAPRADNDNWVPLTGVRFANYGAFALDFGSRDAALETTLGPGDHSAIAQAPGEQGTVLVELYRAPGSLLRLINVSARGNVDGERVIIAGFAIGGDVPMRVLVRAAGPALAAPPFNLTGTLADPTLTLYRGSQPLWENDNWDRGLNAAEVRTAFTAVGAFPFPASSRDSAMLLTLAPGTYTAVVRGVAASSGTALVEVYEAR